MFVKSNDYCETYYEDFKTTKTNQIQTSKLLSIQDDIMRNLFFN